MDMNQRSSSFHGLAIALCMAACPFMASATEGGGSTYVAGGDIWLQGAVPPPGLYVLQYGNVYSAHRLDDESGDALPIPGFGVHVAATATRFVWSTPLQLLGGNLVLHAILPLVSLKVEAGGASQRHTGLGDVTFGPGLATHYSPHLHSVVGMDFVAPTGAYDKNDLANVGRNYWTVEPLYTMAYTDDAGFNGDFKATLNLNQKNSATDYRSGNEFILDYTAGYAVAPHWVAGVSGYVYRQIQDDRQNGVVVDGARGRSAAAGPAFMFNNGKGWLFTAKFQKEFDVHSRTQGSAVVFKTVWPF